MRDAHANRIDIDEREFVGSVDLDAAVERARCFADQTRPSGIPVSLFLPVF